MTTRGFVTLGVGGEHYELATRLARTIARYGHQTALVTEKERPWGYGPVQVVAVDESDRRNIWALKLGLDTHPFWDTSVFCDADALAIDNPGRCLDIAEAYEFHLPIERALGPADTWNYPKLGPMHALIRELHGDVRRAHVINGGYIGFTKSPSAGAWFAASRAAHRRMAAKGEPREELAMMLALAAADVPLLRHQNTIAQVWACEIRRWDPARGRVSVKQPWDEEFHSAMLLHFGSYNTVKDPYISAWAALEPLCPP